MVQYVDIHAHILPGIDDGAKDFEETKQLLSMAYEEGIRAIIATPHFIPSQDNDKVMEAFYQTRDYAKKIDREFHIYLGNEILFREGCIEDVKSGKVNTMAGSRYVLLEFYPQTSYQLIYASLRTFILSGYAPILAHVERYDHIFQYLDRLKELLKLGCYLQMNTRSFVGGIFDKRARYCRKLVYLGLIQFVSSDCHDKKDRVPIMNTALDQLRKKQSEEQLQMIASGNGNKVIHNIMI